MGYKRIGVTASEMMAMREQGLSNKDIANVLEINPLTVRRYIGCQPQRRMENMAAFKENKPNTVEVETVETPEIKRAVDEVVVRKEMLSSRSGNVAVNVDYISHTAEFDVAAMTFDELEDFATFVIGMVERIRKEAKK
jgi:predicted transcriptional regulator